MCRPAPGCDSAGQRWELVKNKRGRLGSWQVHWTGNGFAEVTEIAEPA